MRTPLPQASPIDSRRFRTWLDDFGAYRHPVTKTSIESWLDQFVHDDRDTAARVLDAVEFFGQDRIAAAFRKSLRAIPGWDADASNRSGRWRFAAYSSSSGESGDSMVHQFRLANNLDGRRFKELFIYRSDLVLQKLGSDDTVVLLDDFVGTGDQVCKTWAESFAELVAGIGRVYLVVVAAVQNARRRIGDATELSLVPSHELHGSDNLFSDRCTHFTASEKERLLHYCSIADREHPRGYGDCGLVVVFQHRCPNDSLPVLHANHTRWEGLFPRHD